MENVKEVIREFAKEVLDLGIDSSELQICDSETSFGKSSYLYVGNKKVRYSDHGVTSTQRILNELHLCNLTWNAHLQEIERYYFPERYETVSFKSFNGGHEATQKKVDNLIATGQEFEYIKENFKISAKGNLIHIIRVKNVERVEYIKIIK